MKSTLTLRSGGHPMTADLYAPWGKSRGLASSPTAATA